MAAIGERSRRGGTKTLHPTRGALGITIAVFCALVTHGQAGAKEQFCSKTARTLFEACKAGVADDTLVKKAVCSNTSDAGQRARCLEQARAERGEAIRLCRDQQDTRLDTCKTLGEGRYDPAFGPSLFDDPKAPTKPNPYFPLTVGNRWEYRTGNEGDVVEIVN